MRQEEGSKGILEGEKRRGRRMGGGRFRGGERGRGKCNRWKEGKRGNGDSRSVERGEEERKD